MSKIPHDSFDLPFKIRSGRSARGSESGRSLNGALGGRLTKALIKAGRGAKFSQSHGGDPARGFSGDARQRVVVKVSFRKHFQSGGGPSGAGGGGMSGGGGLRAHVSYLERDSAAREDERGHFFDREHDTANDARDRMLDWEDDPRHFRIMLAPESGARIALEPGGMMDFTRDVMAGMERDLGVGLEWFGVEHHNTDNPHVHVVVRGVREDGIELRLGRDYISHGLRECAREAATQLLGERSLEDERLRLSREIGSPSLTRLDQAIERQLDHKREVMMQSLGQDRSPAFGDSLRARMQELERMGLASEVRRNVYAMEKGWLERLEAAKPLDISRSLSRAQLYERSMGRVCGQVLELGPRGENPDRALLILDTPEHGRVLVNTSREAIQDLQRGSLVTLEPAGKRPDIERLSYHSPAQQLMARADTELDRELDRIAKGQPRLLPELPNVERCLAERAARHIEKGLGAIDRAGNFAFKDGARQQLHEQEMREAGRTLAAERGGEFREIPRFMDDRWTVRGAQELFSGKAAVLDRVGDIAIAPLAKGQELQIGQHLSLKFDRAQDLSLHKTLQVTQHLSRGLELGR